MSFWYWFSIVLMIICIIGGIALGSEENWGAGLGIIVGSMIFSNK